MDTKQLDLCNFLLQRIVTRIDRPTQTVPFRLYFLLANFYLYEVFSTVKSVYTRQPGQIRVHTRIPHSWQSESCVFDKFHRSSLFILVDKILWSIFLLIWKRKAYTRPITSCTYLPLSISMNKQPIAAENELSFRHSLLHRDSKGIKDTRGFNNRRLFWQVHLRVVSQMDFALSCRKLHGTLYFLFSLGDASWRTSRILIRNCRGQLILKFVQLGDDSHRSAIRCSCSFCSVFLRFPVRNLRERDTFYQLYGRTA